MSYGKLPVIFLAGALATGGALVARKFLYKPKPPAGTAVVSTTPPTTTTAPAIASRPVESPAIVAARMEAELAELRRQVEERVSAEPKNANLRMQAARAYLQAGAAPLAIPHLQTAARLQPQDTLTWVALGDTATLASKLDVAEAAYQRADELDPGNAFVYRGRGQVRVRRRDLPGAAKILRAGLARHPKDEEIRTALGNVLILLEDGEGAKKVLEPALQANPSRADLHFLMGRAYELLRQLQAAAAEMQQASTLDPQRDDAFGRLGLYRVSLAEYEQARKPLQQAIQLNPQEPHYFWALGDSYALDPKAADLPKAIELYRQALKIEPSNSNAMRSLMLVLTRRAAKGDLEESVKLLERLVKLNPKDLNAYYNLAATYRRLGRTAEAARASAKFEALSHAQQFSEGVRTPKERLRLGREAMKRGDYVQAATHLQAALEADPRSTEVRAEMEKVSRKLAESQP
ncbi:MAG: tetratricopeptide repeat protein [Armatimonadetes bacterium]|jgi:tetratricopeptide (TPR) repeat protein|nr:tetratricopeptide repeat protein [Armatimonadota bacterium]